MGAVELTVEDIAAVVHEAHRGLQMALGDELIAPSWIDVPPEMAAEVVRGVRLVVDGEQPEAQHDAWRAGREADGWTYGPVKSFDDKTHPCLVAYDELPAAERLKDTMRIRVVSTLLPFLVDDEDPDPGDPAGDA